MRRSDLVFVIKSFLGWRALLFIFAFLATLVISGFGNRFPYADRVLTVTGLPAWIWGFGNFDGVHYLKIAQNGYSAWNSQAFFPLYPILIRFLNFIPKWGLDPVFYTDPSYFYTAMILSALFFVPALYFLFRLWQEEHGHKVAALSIFLLLSFPTAFYFGAVYSEALFLLLAVLTFWFARKEKFILAGIAAALAGATKIQGILLLVFLVVEFVGKKKIDISKILSVFLAPSGLIFYMLYLKRTVGDSLFFLSSQPGFGAERSSQPFILLPQVIFRYFKIFLTVNPASLSFFIAFLEFFLTTVFLIVLVMAFRKMKLSYWLFSLSAVILPTLTGTFSSMPRYVLLAFPLFSYLAVRFKRGVKLIIIIQALLQIVLLSMFVRGYWVS